MKGRMGAWAVFFKVIGWICVIGGFLSIPLLWGASIAIISVGLVCWFSCAVLEWMDGVTDQLIGSRQIQSQLAEELFLLRRQLDDKQAEAEPSEPETQEEKLNAEKTEMSIAEAGSRRRRPAHDQGE